MTNSYDKWQKQCAVVALENLGMVETPYEIHNLSLVAKILLPLK